MAAVTLHNGATTANTPTAWVAVPSGNNYIVQVSGSNGVMQFSNDQTNALVAPGGVITTTSDPTGGLNYMHKVTNLPVAFMRFVPNSTQTTVVVAVTNT